MPTRPSFPEIIAHRGASHDAPENTVAAALLGWTQGADAVEIDVHLGAAGLVVIHDATTRRTTGRAGRVARLSREDLRARDAGSWKHPRFAGERVPVLAEILDAMPDEGGLVLEIKTGIETIEPLARELEASGRAPERFSVIAFDAAVAETAKRRLPRCRVLRLADWAPRRRSHRIENLVRVSREAGLDGLNLGRRWPIDRDFVHVLHAAGLAVFVWTVDDPGEARGLVRAGVDGITTNRPGWLRQRLAEGP